MKRTFLQFNKKYSVFLILLIVVGFVMFLTSCADNVPYKACVTGHTYGFWGGLWHGFIAPFDLVGMLIWDDVAFYAPNNTGTWYAFGFLLGSGGWGFIASKGRKK